MKVMKETCLTNMVFVNGSSVGVAEDCVQWRPLLLAALKPGFIYRRTSEAGTQMFVFIIDL